MGSTRFRLGKGFTIGASGLRYGRSIPGVKRGYVSVGKSGTLLTGGGVRHWEGSGRGRRAVPAAGAPLSRGQRNTLAWARLGISRRAAGIITLVVLTFAAAVIIGAFVQMYQHRAGDTAAGLAAARAAGAPGICLANNVSQDSFGTAAAGHYSWTISTTGTCDPNLTVHFVAVGP